MKFTAFRFCVILLFTGTYSAISQHTIIDILREGSEPNESQQGEKLVTPFFSSPKNTLTLLAAPANDNCANAASLNANSTCTAGTLASATTQSGENTSTSGHCGASSFTMTVWYKFTATNTDMWVQTYLSGLSGGGGGYYPGRFTAVVYNSNSCLPGAGAVISCATMNSQGYGDGIVTNRLTGLTVNNTYLIQIGYNAANGSQDPAFCIRIGDQYSADCSTCNTNCGQACGFPTAPAPAQVTAACTPYPYTPYIEGSETSTRCHSFIASNSTVSFQVIVNTTCGSGNVTNFSWQLYSASCGSPIQSGTLSNMTFSGLSIGQSYVYCYTYTVPSGCYHTIHYPYFVGAAPLPVELISFTVNSTADLKANLKWVTGSEINNQQFEVERSEDGDTYQTIYKTPGAGNSTITREYKCTDMVSEAGLYYYRLKQTDFNGAVFFSDPVATKISGQSEITLLPNPVQDMLLISMQSKSKQPVTITVINQHGKTVVVSNRNIGTGMQQIPVSLQDIPSGVYTVRVATQGDFYIRKIVKI